MAEMVGRGAVVMVMGSGGGGGGVAWLPAQPIGIHSREANLYSFVGLGVLLLLV